MGTKCTRVHSFDVVYVKCPMHTAVVPRTNSNLAQHYLVREQQHDEDNRRYDIGGSKFMEPEQCL